MSRSVAASLTPDRPIAVVEEIVVASGRFLDPTEEIVVASGGLFMLVDEFACTSKSCAPPPVGTGGSLGRGGEIPVRIGMGAAARREGTRKKLGEHARLNDFSDKDQQKMLDDFVKSTGLSHLRTPEDAVKFMEEEIERQFLEARDADPSLLDRHWYVAANGTASELSSELGATNTAVGAGVLAVTSPQTPWPDNIAMGKEITRLFASGSTISKSMLQQAYADMSNEAMAEVRKSMTEEQFLEAYGSTTWKTVDPVIGGAIFKSHLQYTRPPILALDQKLVPGTNGEYVYEEGNRVVAKSGESGMKALMILQAHERHGDSPEFYEALSWALGDGSKVRSFYNNINDPSSALHLTGDTHAIAGASGFPVGAATPIVKNMMSPGSVTQGVSRSYPLLQEAFNRVAERYGLLPREVQSITWVQQRKTWPDTLKTAYTGVGSEKRPVVSPLQRQMALSLRGPEGVAQGRAYRDAIRPLLAERAEVSRKGGSGSTKRTREINAQIEALNKSLGLTDDELRAARRYAAPESVYNKEKKAGVTVP